MRTLTHHIKQRKKIHLHIMYVYDYNIILTSAIKNIGDKEMIWAFTEITEYLKIREINPGSHFMDNEALEAFKNYNDNHGHQV